MNRKSEADQGTHKPLVTGSIPVAATTRDVLHDDYNVKEMLEMVLGTEGRRKLRLRHKTNSELFQLYDAQLVLRHQSQEALEEARRVTGHFRDCLGEYPPSPELATGFLAQFSQRKPRTLYRYLQIIQGFMKWYGEPLEHKIKVPHDLPPYIEAQEIERLKESLGQRKTHKKEIQRNILLIDMATKTGLRRSELANLKVKDIDLMRTCLVVRQGKGMKDRVVDLTPSLVESLQVYLKGKYPEDSIFGLAPATISNLVLHAAKKAGVDLHTHSLRHFFGTRLVDTGADLETVRRLMGHSSLSVTQRYLGRSDQQRKDAIRRLESPVLEDEGKAKMPTAELVPVQSLRLDKPLQTQKGIQRDALQQSEERLPFNPLLAKLREKHQMDMLDLMRRWKTELSPQLWPHSILELGRPGLHHSEEGLVWVVGNEGVLLKLPVTLDTDGEANLKWKCLCEHLRRSNYSWLLEKLGEWQQSGGAELEGRDRLATWVVTAVRNIVDRWPGWGSVRNARGEPTRLFGTTLVATAIDGFCAEYPSVSEPNIGLYNGYFGAFSIGTASSQMGAGAFQLAHHVLSAFMRGQPVTQATEMQLLEAILSAGSPPDIGALRGMKAKREAIGKTIEKGIAELSVIGVAPGTCRFCPR